MDPNHHSSAKLYKVPLSGYDSLHPSKYTQCIKKNHHSIMGVKYLYTTHDIYIHPIPDLWSNTTLLLYWYVSTDTEYKSETIV